ncbi:MAG TPA: hypothetical protein VGH55_00320 [Chthoniobacterales bacterium]
MSRESVSAEQIEQEISGAIYLQLMRVALMNSRFGVAVAALIAVVLFGPRDARSQILADILVLKSGEKVEGRITNESEMSVTISAETPTGQTERMIPRVEISSLTRNEALAPAKTPEPESSKEADLSSVSPDKKWEYQPDESAPKIVKADTNEVALDLSDQPAGNGFSFARVGFKTVGIQLWAGTHARDFALPVTRQEVGSARLTELR